MRTPSPKSLPDQELLFGAKLKMANGKWKMSADLLCAFSIFHLSFFICHSKGGSLLARIDRGVTMDPVTSPLIHKDSGRQARVDPGEENPSQNP